MKKYFIVDKTVDSNGAVNLNLTVMDVDTFIHRKGMVADGSIDTSDSDGDIKRTATVVVAQAMGFRDDELIDRLVQALNYIISQRPKATISIDGEHFA